MEKYMGNKSKICNEIFSAVSDITNGAKGLTLFDPFSGTANVSRFFKKNGFNIVCNDINDLSYVLSKCYIECSDIPKFEILFNDAYFKKVFEKCFSDTDNFNNHLNKLIFDNHNTTDFEFIEKIKNTPFLYLLTYLSYFASEEDWDKSYRPYYLIQKNYCENGSHSRYLNQVHKKSIINLKNSFNSDSKEYRLFNSFLAYPYDTKYLEKLIAIFNKKGDSKNEQTIRTLLGKNLVGSRKFFSLEHGKRIDIILNLINYWFVNKLISDIEYYVLLTSLLESAALFSNTSATYQAFYKDYRLNTKQDFRLIIPVLDNTKIVSQIFQNDIFSIISDVNADVLYLDPPYNWRQYDSNYHLLNTIAKFNKIKDWVDFEKGIVGASGENREKKLKYTSFNMKKDFEKLIIDVINLSKCEYVVLSYSDSKSNHERDGVYSTVDKLKEYFSNEKLFKNYYINEVKSICFESRKGNKKNTINELLFIAQKANN